MMTKETARAAGVLLGNVVGDLLAGVTDEDNGFLGLERKPIELKGKKRTPEATLLTIREDLTSMREKLLKGAGRRAMLAEMDYTIDQLDNVLGEM